MGNLFVTVLPIVKETLTDNLLSDQYACKLLLIKNIIIEHYWEF